MERKADETADKIISSPGSTQQRQDVHLEPVTDASQLEVAAPPWLDRHRALGEGAPLAPALRSEMEARFGCDFSHVRVHADAAAERSAADTGASAYTAGRDVVFGTGEFRPSTCDGRRLIAHELTHVVQQSRVAPHSDVPRLQRKPARTREADTPKRRTIIAIHAEPGAKVGEAYLFGTSETVPIELTKNELAADDYTLIRRDKPETTRVEYEHEDGRTLAFKWRLGSRTIDTAERLDVVIRAGEFRLEEYAKTEFEAVPERIKKRLTKRGAPLLTTTEEYLGFAEFARTLHERGVTDEQLALFQERSGRLVDPRRRFDWAHDWRDAVDAVMGSAGELQKHEAENTERFQALGVTFEGAPKEAFDLYLASLQGSPVLRALAEEKLSEAGLDLFALEEIRRLMLAEFDFRIRAETNVALDKFEGSLVLASELLRSPDVEQRIEAARTAANTEPILRLKAEKEQARKERDKAEEKEAITRVRQFNFLSGIEQFKSEELKRAEQLSRDKEAAYQQSRQAHRGALQAKTDLRVSSLYGLEEDEFFYEGSATESQRRLHAYVVGKLYEVRRARAMLNEDRGTIYKADMMVSLTKERMGVTKGTELDRLVDQWVEECADAPWWSKLLDILSFALIFVPGGAGIVMLRFGISGVQLATTIDNEVMAEMLNRVGTKQEGGSAGNVFVSAVGAAFDVGDVAKLGAKVATGVAGEVTVQAPKVVSEASETARVVPRIDPGTDVPMSLKGTEPPSHLPPDSPAGAIPSPTKTPPRPGHRGATAQRMGEQFEYSYHPEIPAPQVLTRRSGATPEYSAEPRQTTRPGLKATTAGEPTFGDLPEAVAETTEGTATASRSLANPEEIVGNLKEGGEVLGEGAAAAGRPSVVVESLDSAEAVRQAGIPSEVSASGTVFTGKDFPELVPARPLPRSKPAAKVHPPVKELKRGIAGKRPTSAPEPKHIQHTEFRADVDLTIAALREQGAQVAEIAVNRTQRVGSGVLVRKASRRTRPDLQLHIIDARLNGRRIVIEYDKAPGHRSMKHARDILSKDPDAIVIIKIVGFE